MMNQHYFRFRLWKMILASCLYYPGELKASMSKIQDGLSSQINLNTVGTIQEEILSSRTMKYLVI